MFPRWRLSSIKRSTIPLLISSDDFCPNVAVLNNEEEERVDEDVADFVVVPGGAFGMVETKADTALLVSILVVGGVISVDVDETEAEADDVAAFADGGDGFEFDLLYRLLLLRPIIVWSLLCVLGFSFVVVALSFFKY